MSFRLSSRNTWPLNCLNINYVTLPFISYVYESYHVTYTVRMLIFQIYVNLRFLISCMNLFLWSCFFAGWTNRNLLVKRVNSTINMPEVENFSYKKKFKLSYASNKLEETIRQIETFAIFQRWNFRLFCYLLWLLLQLLEEMFNLHKYQIKNHKSQARSRSFLTRFHKFQAKSHKSQVRCRSLPCKCPKSQARSQSFLISSRSLPIKSPKSRAKSQ